MSAIKKSVEEGRREEALVEIDHLLELGPSNTDALKLKAQIYGSEGKVHEEAQVWHRIIKIDREDEDAIEYYLKQQNEDREHFYFTDPIASGGRRYLAYPKSLFYAAILGLMGCVSFVSLTRLASSYKWLGDQNLLLASFGVLVLGPWFAILYGWARSLKALVISHQGIVAETRFRKIEFGWKDVQEVTFAYDGDPSDPSLSLVVRSKNPADRPLVIDLSEESSSLRARSHLIREITHYAPRVVYAPLASLALPSQRSY